MRCTSRPICAGERHRYQGDPLRAPRVGAGGGAGPTPTFPVARSGARRTSGHEMIWWAKLLAVWAPFVVIAMLVIAFAAVHAWLERRSERLLQYESSREVAQPSTQAPAPPRGRHAAVEQPPPQPVSIPPQRSLTASADAALTVSADAALTVSADAALTASADGAGVPYCAGAAGHEHRGVASMGEEHRASSRRPRARSHTCAGGMAEGSSDWRSGGVATVLISPAERPCASATLNVPHRGSVKDQPRRRERSAETVSSISRSRSVENQPELAHYRRWGGWGSNPRPRDYESHALTS